MSESKHSHQTSCRARPSVAGTFQSAIRLDEILCDELASLVSPIASTGPEHGELSSRQWRDQLR